MNKNYQKGDVIKLKVYPIDQRPELWNSHGKMDKWMGRTVTIKDMTKPRSDGKFFFDIEEDFFWTFSSDNIDEYKIELEDDLFEI